MQELPFISGVNLASSSCEPEPLGVHPSVEGQESQSHLAWGRAIVRRHQLHSLRWCLRARGRLRVLWLGQQGGRSSCSLHGVVCLVPVAGPSGQSGGNKASLPQRPCYGRPPSPAAGPAVPEPSWNWLGPQLWQGRPHRRRRRARLTTSLGLYCVSYGDQLGGSQDAIGPLPPVLGREEGGGRGSLGLLGPCWSFLHLSGIRRSAPPSALSGEVAEGLSFNSVFRGLGEPVP